MPAETIQVPSEASGKRLDSYLAGVYADRFSRTRIKEFILAGKVTVDGLKVKPNFIIHEGQKLVTDFDEVRATDIRAEKIAIKIVYEDKDLIVVDKPAGMVVHPACGHPKGTLVNALLYHAKKLSKVGGNIRAGIVHRLDKNTSGLMVIAKNDKTHNELARAFKQHQVEKTYWAVVKGVVEHDEMVCDAALGRSLSNRKLVTIRREGGKESKTHFKVLKRFKQATLLEARPVTGRMHQIRVHLQHLCYPVLGDKEYGFASPLIDRQALHAKSISFVHPATKKKLSFDSKPPSDFALLVRRLSRG